jgi:predicted DNA-binding transcriptional regulator YafY
MAFVEAYAEMRTFAVERIRSVSVQEQTFEPVAELDGDPFGNSMGVHRGPATRVRLRFHAAIAALMKERTWHRSQRFTDRADGSVVMTLDVSDDYALRGWLLGFGRLVKVMSPAALAGAIQEELAQAHAQYDSDAAPVVDSDMQPVLPFVFNRLINA